MSSSASGAFAPRRDLAIVGLGALFPRADGLGAYWSNILEGRDAITEVPASHWRPEDYFDVDPKRPDHTYARRGGFLDPVDFDPLAWGIVPNAIEATDTSQLLGLVCAERALRDAGLAEGHDHSKTSVVLGVTGALELVIPLGARLGHPLWRRALRDAGVPDDLAEDALERMSASYVGWQEASFPGLLGNVVAGRIANRLDTGRTNCVVDAACASSLSAIHLAAMELETGRADLAVTGGIDTFNDIFMYMCFSKTPALSPTGAAKPFDAAGDGTILGEGVGILVLKRLADAERDGDRVYAVLKGMGSSSDGKGQAVYAPSPAGQARAIRSAYEIAGVTADTIELVEAHGTGTRVGDAVEATGLSTVYREAKAEGTWCAVGSVKSQIGHTKAAAGAAGIIKAALALHHRVLPPTIRVEKPVEPLAAADSPLYVNTTARPWLAPAGDHPRRAAVSSFGFGGSNFHAVLEEHAPTPSPVFWDGDVELLAFCADERDALLADVADWPTEDAQAATGAWARLAARAAESRERFDAALPWRAVAVIERDRVDLPRTLAALRTLLEAAGDAMPGADEGVRITTTPDGASVGVGARTGGLAFCFPGQGSQRAGMLRDLVCRFPQARASLEAADRAFAETGRGRLSDFVFPQPSFDDAATAAAEAAVRATDVAQPALGAVSLGAARVLEHLGVAPDATCGHSYGELVALAAAGRIDEDALHGLSGERGRRMAAQAGDDAGTMLAVMAPLADVERLVADERLDLVLANRNAPEQVVLSGATGEIERAVALFDASGMRNRRLPVAAAFHSPLVARARHPFRAALGEVTFTPGRVPVFANATAAPYPDGDEAVRDLLADQLVSPVLFVDEIEALHAEGIRTFVEVGPGARLCGLVDAILGDRNHLAVAIEASTGRRRGVVDLARAVATIAVAGHPVALDRWNEGIADPAVLTAKRRHTIPICGANHVQPTEPKPARPRASIPTLSPEPSVAPATPTPAYAKRGGNGHATPKPAPAVVTATAPTAVTPMRAMSAPPPAAATSSTMLEALRITQENMVALQRFAEQTANLHQQFLAGQEATQQTFQSLFANQQNLLHGAVATAPLAPSAPAPQLSAPTPTPSAPAPAPVPVPEAARPASVAPAPTAPAPAPTTAPATSLAESTLLDVVAEKTGYPTEMLEMGMELDADLGIDSIKRVEILSALKERLPDAPEVTSDHLGTLRTLADVVGFLAPATAATAATATSTATVATPATGPAAGEAEAALLDVVAEKTGYPTEMLEMGMELDADLGIDSIKRVEILSALKERLPEAPEVTSDHLGTLRTLADVIGFLTAASPSSTASTSAAASTATTGPATEEAEAALLAVISEKTGYPAEMLELGMELDADLGIDSIKRVEILSALKERLPHAPEVTSDHLGTLRTLADVIGFLAPASLTAPAPTAPAPTAAAPTAAAASMTTPLARTTVPATTIERRIVCRIDLDELGPRKPIALAKGGAVAIAGASTGPLADRLEAALRDAGLTPSRLAGPTSAIPERLAGLLLLAPEHPDAAFVRDAFLILQAAAPSLQRAREHDGAAVVVTVARLDGAFGLDPDGVASLDPVGGALAGFAKTVRHEWPGVLSKAIDLAPGHDDAAAAKAVVEELGIEGPVEVGIGPRGRSAVATETRPIADRRTRLALGEGDVVVVSGGARGVTAACARAIARAYRPTLLLLGRSPAPEPEPAWLAPLSSEAEIKRGLMESFAAAGNARPSPKLIGEEFGRIAAAREIRAAIASIEAEGARVLYRSVDVRDAAAVASVIDAVRLEDGPIRGVVHGAGVLADRLITEKTPEELDRVYGTKIEGLDALLAATASDELRFTALFSSVTGRYGRRGQVDYAAANQVLDKAARREAANDARGRVVSIAWGPWDGGMVTPALARVFADEGVGLLDLDGGAEHLVAELEADDGAVEVVVTASIRTPAGDGAATDGSPTVTASETPEEEATLTRAFTTTVDPAAYPFLRSHVLDGRAVLPMAMMVEWLAHGAIHGNPGLAFHGFDELRVLKGVTIEAGAPREVRVLVGRGVREGELFRVPTELRSDGGVEGGREIVHARAEILLGKFSTPELAPGERDLELPAWTSDEALYDRILFHGPDLRGIEEVIGCGEEGIVALSRPAPAPSAWIDQPVRSRWLADPLALDVAFQLAIVWSQTQRDAASLPVYAGRYRQHRRSWPTEGTRIVVRVTESAEHRARARILFLDRDGEPVATLDDYECVIDASLQGAFGRNRLEGVAS